MVRRPSRRLVTGTRRSFRDHGNTSEGEREEIEIELIFHRVDTAGIDLKQAAAADFRDHEDEICAWSAFSDPSFRMDKTGFSFPGVLDSGDEPP